MFGPTFLLRVREQAAFIVDTVSADVEAPLAIGDVIAWVCALPCLICPTRRAWAGLQDAWIHIVFITRSWG